MADRPKITTALGSAEEDRILVRGMDLTNELVGKISFSEMTFLELVGRLPTPAEAILTVSLAFCRSEKLW